MNDINLSVGLNLVVQVLVLVWMLPLLVLACKRHYGLNLVSIGFKITQHVLHKYINEIKNEKKVFLHCNRIVDILRVFQNFMLKTNQWLLGLLFSSGKSDKLVSHRLFNRYSISVSISGL